MAYIELTCASLNTHEAETLMYELAELGFESFTEEATGFKGYIKENAFDENECEIEEILLQYRSKTHFELQLIKDQNWNAEWEKNFDPIAVDTRCYVRASFHEPKPGFNHEIIITPKMSFGTGHHATTFLVMKEMLDRNELQGKTVLDMGCGTGILAILASKLGAEHITAIDIDDWPCENSIENVNINKITNVNVEKGDARILAGRSFDVILANINRNVLLEDMSTYIKCLKSGGRLLLSGFYEADIPLLTDEAKALGLSFVSKNSKDNWALLHFNK